MSETTKTILVQCLAHSGYRRAGLVFDQGKNELSADKVTSAQLAQINADARLSIIEDSPVTDSASSGTVEGGDNSLSLIDAIKQLDPDNTDHFTSGGKPQVDALEKLMGKSVSAAERDAAWAELQAQGE